MKSILSEIVEYKRHFVRESRKKMSLREVESLAFAAGPIRKFSRGLDGKKCALIAEIKTASPSRGIIRHDMDIAEVARIFEINGASCISVLTDEKYFGGSLDRLGTIREAVRLPLLRKDFIIDEYQLYEARCAGADAVLLIVSCLDDVMIAEFMEVAALLELDCLVEVHTIEEMERIRNLPVRLVGINNRNLETFETDISTTGRLAPLAPAGTVIVSESGIFNADDVRSVHAMGAHAVLVGEAIMREGNMADKVFELSHI